VLALVHAPYVFLFTVAAFHNMDPVLEDGAKILGASTYQTLIKITLPLLMPAVLAAFIIAFVTGVDNFGVPAILGTPARISVATTTIYNQMAVWPTDYGYAAAISTILMAVTMFLLYMRQFVFLKKKSKFITIAGKGYQPRLVDLGIWKYPLLTLGLLYLALAVVLPYMSLFLASLVSFWNPRSFSFAMCSLDNYISIFTKPNYVRGIINTIIVGFGAATFTIVIATLLSFFSQRTLLRGRKQLEYIANLPLGVPGTVMAVGILLIFVYAPKYLYGTLSIIIIALSIRLLPFSLNTINSTLVQIHPEMDEAAMLLGASWFTILRKIIFPLLRPSLIAAWSLGFILAARELSTTVLLSGSMTELISPLMYIVWTDGGFPEIATLGIIQALIVFTVMFLVRVFSKKIN
jgi:iron(III) transport system permease protein